MKRLARVALISSLLCGGRARAGQTSIGTFTLAPGEKKTVRLEAKNETTVGFTNEGSVDDAKRCQHMCIRMNVPGNQFLDATASMGTSMKITPTDGHLQAVFENLETFPISIDVFHE